MNHFVNILQSCGDMFSQCFVIADLTAKDQQLVYVNDRFCELTGYRREEIVGRNCRFLQGEGTSQYTVAAIKAAIKDSECCFQDVLNFKKNGTPFWNRLFLIPVQYDVLGVRYYVAIQQDITDKKGLGPDASLSDFIARAKPSADMVIKVKNPLSEIQTAVRAMRYFQDGSEESKVAMSEMAEQLRREISTVCQYVRSLD